MGELARSPDCPKMAETPMQLLKKRQGECFSTFDKLFWPCTGFAAGLISSVVYTVLQKRPFWAGLHRHIFITGVCTYGAIFIRNHQFAARMEDEAIYKHYMCLHPEDFPPFERKRYADVYKPFDPLR